MPRRSRRLGTIENFRHSDLRFAASDDPATHQRQMSDPDCSYSVVEAGGLPGGYVILRALNSPNRCVELKGTVVAKPSPGLGPLRGPNLVLWRCAGPCWPVGE
jgi:hypothetical protein